MSSRRKRRRYFLRIIGGLAGGALLLTLFLVFFVVRPVVQRPAAPVRMTLPQQGSTRTLQNIPETVIEQISSRALQGDARAQNDLGVLYQIGKGVLPDDLEATRWYRRAAERNFVLAQNNLGWMYEQGRGVERDYAGALFWYKLAAEAGNTAAQYNLASLYERGLGLQPNPLLASEWYQRAERQGDKDASAALLRLTSSAAGGAVAAEALASGAASKTQRSALASPGFMQALGLQASATR